MPASGHGRHSDGGAQRQAEDAGRQPYFANDPELIAERHAAQRLVARYNATEAGDAAGRMTVLRELFGAVGAGADIQPRFHFNRLNLPLAAPIGIGYGWNALRSETRPPQ